MTMREVTEDPPCYFRRDAFTLFRWPDAGAAPDAIDFFSTREVHRKKSSTALLSVLSAAAYRAAAVVCCSSGAFLCETRHQNDRRGILHGLQALRQHLRITLIQPDVIG